MLRYLTLFLVPLLFMGCGAPKAGKTRLAATPLGYSNSAWAKRLGHIDQKSVIPVFIISGRNLLENPDTVDPFGNERANSPMPHLAIAEVSVGKGMSSEEIIADTLAQTGKKGKTRLALNSVRLVPTPPIDQFTVSREGKHLSGNPWVQEIDRVLKSGSSRRITIFVHGYNTEFITNTEQTAEISHYQARDGAVINFDWPSKGTLTGYFADKGNALYSTRHFRGLLIGLARETCVEEIQILAHSAGNPIVVNAMRELRILQRDLTPAQLQDKYKIRRVILAAPDMDLQIFVNAVYDRFHDVAESVAVYTSIKDRALNISSIVFKALRLGRAAEGMNPWEEKVFLNQDKIEMIDATNAMSHSREFLGHSYFQKNPWVSADINQFYEGVSPEKRFLKRGEGVFWAFPDNYESHFTE